MTDQYLFRRARYTDSVALSELYQQTFREAYIEDIGMSYSESDIESYFRSSVSAEWCASKLADPQRMIWVVEDKRSGEIVASVMGGPCDLSHMGMHQDDHGEITRFYIRRDSQGQGLGRQLMKMVLSWLEEQFPGRPIWIDVFSNNSKALKFYAHYGFKIVVQYDYALGQRKDAAFIMQRKSSLL